MGAFCDDAGLFDEKAGLSDEAANFATIRPGPSCRVTLHVLVSLGFSISTLKGVSSTVTLSSLVLLVRAI